jgi:hypothetical protein
MKRTIPERTIEVCDSCGREGYLQTCVACGGKYCLTDDGIVPGSFGFVDVCRDCGKRDDVRAICDRYSKKLAPIFRARQLALGKLRHGAKLRQKKA